MQEDLVVIDWLSITSKIHTQQQIIALLGMESATWTLTKGAHGYKDRLYYYSKDSNNYYKYMWTDIQYLLTRIMG